MDAARAVRARAAGDAGGVPGEVRPLRRVPARARRARSGGGAAARPLRRRPLVVRGVGAERRVRAQRRGAAHVPAELRPLRRRRHRRRRRAGPRRRRAYAPQPQGRRRRRRSRRRRRRRWRRSTRRWRRRAASPRRRRRGRRERRRRPSDSWSASMPPARATSTRVAVAAASRQCGASTRAPTVRCGRRGRVRAQPSADVRRLREELRALHRRRRRRRRRRRGMRGPSADCAGWAKLGECERNAAAMRASCPRACGACAERNAAALAAAAAAAQAAAAAAADPEGHSPNDDECADRAANCPDRAAAGDCWRDPTGCDGCARARAGCATSPVPRAAAAASAAAEPAAEAASERRAPAAAASGAETAPRVWAGRLRETLHAHWSVSAWVRISLVTNLALLSMLLYAGVRRCRRGARRRRRRPAPPPPGRRGCAPRARRATAPSTPIRCPPHGARGPNTRRPCRRSRRARADAAPCRPTPRRCPRACCRRA